MYVPKPSLNADAEFNLTRGQNFGFHPYFANVSSEGFGVHRLTEPLLLYNALSTKFGVGQYIKPIKRHLLFAADDNFKFCCFFKIYK